jgi:hypothetical protein
VALALGTVGILSFGSRRSKEAAVPAARDWPRGRLAVALGIVVILDGITLTNMDLAIKMQLTAARAEAGAKILALAPPRLPDQDNAAVLYRKAFETLTPLEQLPTPWKEKRTAWLEVTAQFDFQDKDLAEFLRSQEPGLALLRKAAVLPGCSFERDYFQSVDLLLPEAQKMREGAALLALDARSKARRGDAAGALEDVAALFGIARHANEPILITLLVSGAIDRLGVSTLEDVLAHVAPKPEELGRLTLQDVSYNRALQRTLQMEEAALGLPLISVVNTGVGGRSKWLQDEIADPISFGILDSPLYRVFFLTDDLAAYSHNMKRSQDLAGRPYAEARADWDALEKSIKATRGGGLLAGLILPAVQKCVVAAARTDATHRLGQAAIAVETYRVKNGKFPERVDDLIPDYLPRVPTDPFNGQSLRLKHDGKDLVLYSVGPGGIPGKETERHDDIAFRLHGR